MTPNQKDIPFGRTKALPPPLVGRRSIEKTAGNQVIVSNASRCWERTRELRCI